MKSKRATLIVTLAIALAVAAGLVVYADTVVSVAFSDPTITCNASGTGATVTFNYTVTSNSSSAATVTGAIDDGTPFALPGIATTDWTCGSPCNTKTAEGTYTTTLTNGTHTFEVCATQPGSGGNPDKTGCETQTVVVNCSPASTGCSSKVFGEVPANKNLCSASGKIEIQFSGDFGPTATLEIDGPNDFSTSFPVDRAGASCNYHYNWDPGTGNGGPGNYSFKVTGTGLSGELDFTATLQQSKNCR